jgi:hypothetical protein
MSTMASGARLATALLVQCVRRSAGRRADRGRPLRQTAFCPRLRPFPFLFLWPGRSAREAGRGFSFNVRRLLDQLNPEVSGKALRLPGERPAVTEETAGGPQDVQFPVTLTDPARRGSHAGGRPPGRSRGWPR